MTFLLGPKGIPTLIAILCLCAGGRDAWHGDVGHAGYWLICATLFAWVTFAMKG